VSLFSALSLLFLAALAAATVIPSQSEWILFWLLGVKKYSPVLLLAAATAGNVLGSVINWWLGRYLARFRGRKWFPVTDKQFARAETFFQKYGVWSLLLAWVPFIGDPLTLAAGTLGVRLDVFLTLVTVSKLGRYLAVYAVFLGFF
jgi:membrane protein YqaA with SNARE-associated domain